VEGSLNRGAQKCRVQKTSYLFFFVIDLSGKLGPIFLRFRAAITFFFWHYCLLCTNRPNGRLETILCFSEGGAAGGIRVLTLYFYMTVYICPLMSQWEWRRGCGR
jgi:hypothetical protein